MRTTTSSGVYPSGEVNFIHTSPPSSPFFFFLLTCLHLYLCYMQRLTEILHEQGIEISETTVKHVFDMLGDGRLGQH